MTIARQKRKPVTTSRGGDHGSPIERLTACILDGDTLIDGILCRCSIKSESGVREDQVRRGRVDRHSDCQYQRFIFAILLREGNMTGIRLSTEITAVNHNGHHLASRERPLYLRDCQPGCIAVGLPVHLAATDVGERKILTRDDAGAIRAQVNAGSRQLQKWWRR